MQGKMQYLCQQSERAFGQHILQQLLRHNTAYLAVCFHRLPWLCFCPHIFQLYSNPFPSTRFRPHICGVSTLWNFFKTFPKVHPNLLVRLKHFQLYKLTSFTFILPCISDFFHSNIIIYYFIFLFIISICNKHFKSRFSQRHKATCSTKYNFSPTFLLPSGRFSGRIHLSKPVTGRDQTAKKSSENRPKGR